VFVSAFDGLASCVGKRGGGLKFNTKKEGNRFESVRAERLHVKETLAS